MAAGPAAFGKSELNRSFSARGLKPIPVLTEIVPGRPPGSFLIQPGRPAKITGGAEIPPRLCRPLRSRGRIKGVNCPCFLYQS